VQGVDQTIDGRRRVLFGGLSELGVERGGGGTGVPEQALDMSKTQALFEQVRGKAVATGINTLLINRIPFESTTDIIPTMANRSTSSGVCDASMMKRSSSGSTKRPAWPYRVGCLTQRSAKACVKQTVPKSPLMPCSH
jgi:hypothetical protein